MPHINEQSRKKNKKKNKKNSSPRKPGDGLLVSNTRKPDKMQDREWQTILRIQIAEKENFVIKNLTPQPVYSDYTVYSPASKNTYKVALRSKDNSLNFCSCPDFKINQLGTCKHIEAVRRTLRKKKGIKKQLEEIPVLSYSSIYVSYTDERKIKLRIGTENKSKFEKWAGKYFDKSYIMFPAAYLQMEQILQEAYHISSSFRCYDDAIALIVEKRDAIKRETLIKKEGANLLQGVVTASLFPYQQQGILFALKAGRSILADDMGLGKTVQAISWAMLMHKHAVAQKVIIICPTSLK